MPHPRILFSASAAALVLTAACGDVTGSRGSAPPHAPLPDVSPPGGERVMKALTCRATVQTGEVVCGVITDDGELADNPRTLSDPDHFALIVHGTSRNTSTETGVHTVSIRNDIGQTIGTYDAEYPDTLRIFIVDGPTTTSGSGTVAVNNADGVGNLTGPGQPFFEVEEMVAPGNQTSTFDIGFNIPNSVVEFTYTVMVSAPVRHPDGWITVDGDKMLPQGVSRHQVATVYEWTGVVNDTTWLYWYSDNPTIVTLSGEPGTHQFQAVAVSTGHTWTTIETSTIYLNRFYVVY